MKTVLCLALLLALPVSLSAAAAVSGATRVDDRAALHRLRRNSGMTLQWISFASPRRGHVAVTEQNGIVHLRGTQRGNGGEIVLDGDVLQIGQRSFRFAGNITITNAPDQGRVCVREGEFEFRVTQNRRYWRLQQMEACDGLTDYVDIYF